MKTGWKLALSKINWAAFVLVILGGLQEMNWVDVLGSDNGGKVIAFIGVVIMVFRTFFTNAKPDAPKE